MVQAKPTNFPLNDMNADLLISLIYFSNVSRIRRQLVPFALFIIHSSISIHSPGGAGDRQWPAKF
jgi:hypothetical protein